MKELKPSHNYVRVFVAEYMPVTWVSRFWYILTTCTGTLGWNPSNHPSFSVVWDHLFCGNHAIPCLSFIWIHLRWSRDRGGWRARIVVWVNINTNYVLSTWFLLKFLSSIALFPDCELKILLVRNQSRLWVTLFVYCVYHTKYLINKAWCPLVT